MANVTAVTTPSATDPKFPAASGVSKTGQDTNNISVNVVEQSSDATGNVVLVLSVSGKMDSATDAVGTGQAPNFAPVIITPASSSKSNNQTVYITCTLGGYKDGANWTLKASVTGGTAYTFIKGKGGAGV